MLVQAHAKIQTGFAKSPREVRGVDDGRVEAFDPAEEDGRFDDALDLVAVEKLEMDIVLFCECDDFVERVEKIRLGGEVDFTCALVITFDVESRERRFDLREIVDAERVKRFDLTRPTRLPVEKSMCNGRVHEAAVASAGADGGFTRFEDDDVAGGVFLLGEQGCPQACLPRADDEQVGGNILS